MRIPLCYGPGDQEISPLRGLKGQTCVDFMKGKQTNMSKKGVNRSSSILEIIHTDICCSDMDARGQKYFFTFIVDYSQDMNVYLLHNKNEAQDAFNVFKAKVENQCGKQIKIERSDRGIEYCGKYTKNRQTPGRFAKFLQEMGLLLSTLCLALQIRMV